MDRSRRTPLNVGVWLALAAAASFGVSTPLVQIAGRELGPFGTAACLYAGAALATVGSRDAGEAPPGRAEVARLAVVALFGAVLAPAMLAVGLQRASGASAALLLTLEAPLTALFGVLVFREALGARALGALATITTGAALLAGGDVAAAGAPWIAGACLAWALDNTLSRPLADFDPVTVVRVKSSLGALLSTALVLVRGEPLPSPLVALALLACGAFGYGASLRLYLRAQRRIGAGRTASVFATAPFLGAVAAAALGQPVGAQVAVAGALMAVGAWLHLGEQHDHAHIHPAITHDHPHRHDDGHHDDHPHQAPPAGFHSHTHTHLPRDHAHAHGEDVHHRHEHPRKAG